MNGLIQALGAIAVQPTQQPARPAMPNWDMTSPRSRWAAAHGTPEEFYAACDDADLTWGSHNSRYEVHALAQAEMDAAHAEALIENERRDALRARLGHPDVKPNPGSAAAIAAGCRCAVRDNAAGNGYLNGGARDADGSPLFYVNDDCPLHGAGGEK